MPSQSPELSALLLENASRDKTPEQRVREGVEWKRIEEKEAHIRMSEAAKAQRQGVENFPHLKQGKSRDKVAERVGFGTGRTYEKAAKRIKICMKICLMTNCEKE